MLFFSPIWIHRLRNLSFFYLLVVPLLDLLLRAICLPSRDICVKFRWVSNNSFKSHYNFSYFYYLCLFLSSFFSTVDPDADIVSDMNLISMVQMLQDRSMWAFIITTFYLPRSPPPNAFPLLYTYLFFHFPYPYENAFYFPILELDS